MTMKLTACLLPLLLTLALQAQIVSGGPPVEEFLAVLDLPTREEPKVPIEPALAEFANQNGLVIKRFEVATAKPISAPPTGRDILRFELADTSRFDCVSVKDGPVIAIYPVVTTSFVEQALKNGKKLSYFDLTPFAAMVPASAAADESLWKAAGDTIRSLREKVQKFDHLVNPDGNLQAAYSNRKPYGRVIVHMKDEKLELEELDPADFKGGAAAGGVDTHELIFPVLPTVYSPACGENKVSDPKVATHVLQQVKKLSLRDGDPVLDVGTGTGYLVWLAWNTARVRGFDVKMHALDINPVAVANARYVARLAGYPLASKAHDNITDEEGRYAFPGTRFRCVIWNMPSVPPNMGADWKVPGTFRDYWDNGPNGMEVLNRFSAGLRGMLDPAVRKTKDPEGVGARSLAVIWNVIPQGGPNVVEQTFKKAGFNTRLLEQYPDYGVQCIIYALE